VFDGEIQVITGNELGQFVPEHCKANVFVFSAVVPLDAVTVAFNV